MLPRRPIRTLACAAALSVSPSAWALVGYYWNGGSGTWDTTTARWSDTSSTGPFNVDFANGHVTTFGNSAGTVTLGLSLTPGAMTFAIGGFILATGGNNLTVSGGLTLDGSTTFDFGTGAGSLTFAAGSNSWSTNTLTIDDYVDGTSILNFGTTSSGLGAGDLSDIVFAGYSDGGAAQIDSLGNITPVGAIPEPPTCAGILGIIALGAAGARHCRKRALARI